MTSTSTGGGPRDPLRIVMVIATLGGGGAERVVVELAGRWAHRGDHLTIVTLAPADDAYAVPSGVERQVVDLAATSTNIFQSLGRTITRTRRLRAAVRALRPDLVLSFMDATNLRVISAVRGTGIPLVINEETDPETFPIARKWRVLQRVLYSHANALTVRAEGIRPWADRIMRDPARVHVVPNAVWLETRSRSGASPGGRPVILGMGRLVPEKGFDVLLRAFATVAADHPDWDVVIHGEGTQRAALEMLAASLGIADRVGFPGHTDDPASAYASAGIFAMPSRSEAFGLALVEAMASGLPVVATALRSGPAEVVEAGVNGMLVPPEDPAALADALGLLMSDHALMDRLGRAALEVATRYSPEAVDARWDDVVQSVLR